VQAKAKADAQIKGTPTRVKDAVGEKGEILYEAPGMGMLVQDPETRQLVPYNGKPKPFAQTNINLKTAAQEITKTENKAKASRFKTAQERKTSEFDAKFADNLKKSTQTGMAKTTYEDYNTVDKTLKNIEKYAANPSAYADVGTLLMGAKALQNDTSVVRDPEMRAMMGASGIINTLQNTIDKYRGTGSLQPEQRVAIAKAIKVARDSARQSYKNVVRPTIEQADENNVPFNRVLPADFVKDFEDDYYKTKVVDSKGKSFRLPNEEVDAFLSSPEGKGFKIAP
jgi:hypothetical protein